MAAPVLFNSSFVNWQLLLVNSQLWLDMSPARGGLSALSLNMLPVQLWFLHAGFGRKVLKVAAVESKWSRALRCRLETRTWLFLSCLCSSNIFFLFYFRRCAYNTLLLYVGSQRCISLQKHLETTAACLKFNSCDLTSHLLSCSINITKEFPCSLKSLEIWEKLRPRFDWFKK